jgi:hypothetical protein
MDLCIVLMALTATLTTGTLAQDAPRRLNEPLERKEFPGALLAGDSFKALFKRTSDGLSCQAGYTICEGEAACRPTGKTCCSKLGLRRSRLYVLHHIERGMS